MPGKALTKINQKVCFTFVTKFGQKGMINLEKLGLDVGGIICDGLDYFETKAIADRSYAWFVKGNI